MHAVLIVAELCHRDIVDAERICIRAIYG
jgi:hypothetical protein